MRLRSSIDHPLSILSTPLLAAEYLKLLLKSRSQRIDVGNPTLFAIMVSECLRKQINLSFIYDECLQSVICDREYRHTDHYNH